MKPRDMFTLQRSELRIEEVSNETLREDRFSESNCMKLFNMNYTGDHRSSSQLLHLSTTHIRWKHQ